MALPTGEQLTGIAAILTAGSLYGGFLFGKHNRKNQPRETTMNKVLAEHLQKECPDHACMKKDLAQVPMLIEKVEMMYKMMESNLNNIERKVTSFLEITITHQYAIGKLNGQIKQMQDNPDRGQWHKENGGKGNSAFI